MAGTPGRKPSPFTPLLTKLRERLNDESIAALPVRGGLNPEAGRSSYDERSKAWAQIRVIREEADQTGWDDILIQRVFTAFSYSEGDTDRAIDTLIGLAATALDAAASLQRQGPVTLL